MKTLKNVLLINALSSAATGVLLIVFRAQIATLFEVNSPMAFLEVGVFLLVFALFVFRESRKHGYNPKNIKLIIIMDIAWVLASVFIIALQLFNLSTVGYTLVAAVAVWVSGMAYLQIAGLKNIDGVKA